MNVPFEIDRTQRMRLTAQVTEGFRHAILTGYYREGDRLPSLRDVCKIFGVSMIVARAAFRRLGNEGLIVPRPHIGCLVAPKNVKVWKGGVLVVSRDEDGSYYVNALVDEMRDRLAESGYLLTQVMVKRGADGRLDLSPLQFALSPSVLLVVQLFRDAELSKFFAKRRVRLMTVGWTPSAVKGAVGDISFDFAPAVGEIVRAAQAAKVRTVLQIGAERHPWSAQAFKSAGFDFTEKIVRPAAGTGVVEGTARASLAFFEKAIAKGEKLPDLIYFTDDYVAQGALAAFAHHALVLPGQVRVVSIANAGLGPIWWQPLARVELDPRAHGRQVAAAAVQFLFGNGFPVGVRLVPAYLPGATF